MECFLVSSRQMLMAHMVAITEKNNVIESVFSPEFASYREASSHLKRKCRLKASSLYPHRHEANKNREKLEME